jgi:hypothetical protein
VPGCGSCGTLAAGDVKSNVTAGLPISDDASRSVNGAKAQRHSISFKMAV